MNWSSAKTILITFLIITNIFLASMLLRSGYTANRVLPETINSTVALLSQHGITVEASDIPAEIESKKIYTVENVISDYEEFVNEVLGSNYTVDGNIYRTDNASISFSGDSFFIKYNNGLSTNEKLKTPAEKAREYLLSIGIDTKDASVTVKNDAHSIFTVAFSKNLGNMPFFDRRVSVELSGTSVSAAYGSWFEKTDASANQSTLNSAPSLLVKYAAQNPEFSNKEIDDILLGYSIGEANIFHKTANILPTYQILCTDGSIFYIDAIS